MCIRTGLKLNEYFLSIPVIETNLKMQLLFLLGQMI